MHVIIRFLICCEPVLCLFLRNGVGHEDYCFGQKKLLEKKLVDGLSSCDGDQKTDWSGVK